MKRTSLILAIGVGLLFLAGCNDNSNPVVYNPSPAAPQGVYSVTGDNAVEIVWNGVYERDINEYIVYRSYQSTTGYAEIGRVIADYNPDLDLIIYSYTDIHATNGTTYYYAVSAVDDDGQESPLSAETVFDTPRPDGSVDLYSMYAVPTLAGFALSASPSRVAWNSVAADIFIDEDIDAVFYLNAADTLTDIQDVGFTGTFDEIGYAPQNGWSALGWVELILGHTYIIWTNDNHFAKMRVVAIDKQAGLVSFDWAYQTDSGNPELAPGLPGANKPSHGADYLKQIRTVGAEQM